VGHKTTSVVTTYIWVTPFPRYPHQIDTMNFDQRKYQVIQTKMQKRLFPEEMLNDRIYDKS
jgi:hypothetical protein